MRITDVTDVLFVLACVLSPHIVIYFYFNKILCFVVEFKSI